MITEDYVSFKTAKLLLEKGYPFKDCWNWYTDFDNISFPDDDEVEINECRYPLISLGVAMKWLREVHNLHICFRPVIPYKEIEYRAYIFDRNCEPVLSNEFGGTPEYCADMAIKYCLENLI